MTFTQFIKAYFNRIFHLRDTTDKEGTIENINENIDLKGYNIWILICSAVLASIGLDLNSAAVIIGAMLISPLMSPILGVGLSLGINDREMLTRSLRNLGMATFISLFTSFIYFTATPLGDATSEILARTHPTLLDVMVAFFGGIAGIVSGSRKEKTNAIPGVAIATALMPPLCSAGFGLATGDWLIFAGAFYLFIINAIFISMATYVIIKFLRFPLKKYMDQQTKTQVNRFMTFALLFVLVPSAYFLWEVYNKNRINKQVETLVINKIASEQTEVLKWAVEERDSTNVVQVVIAGSSISQKTVHRYDSLLKANGIKNYHVNISRVNISKEEIADMSREVALNLMNTLTIKTHNEISGEQQLSSLIDSNLVREVKIIFPDVQELGAGQIVSFQTTSLSQDSLTHIFIKSNQTMSKQDTRKLYDFLKLKLDKDTLVITNK